MMRVGEYSKYKYLKLATLMSERNKYHWIVIMKLL
jgi:hypothetical protein